MQVSPQTRTRTENFPQWLASPTDKFYIIPVEETCCQNLLEIILKMSRTGPVIFSSPVLLSLFSILMSKTTNRSVSQAKYSGCVPGTSLSLGPTFKLMPILVNSPSLVSVEVMHFCPPFLQITGLLPLFPSSSPRLQFSSFPVHSSH